jgi:hypothetical protein
MSEKSLMDQSRVAWVAKNKGKETIEQIQTGALQRIANATEAMAVGFVQLKKELDSANMELVRLRDLINQRNITISRLYRRISALQGVITKTKRRAKK